MPGGNDQQYILKRIEQEMGALRAAVLANELSAIEGHTETVSELLTRLTPEVQPLEPCVQTQRRCLHDLARNVLVVLQKSRRTVCALSGVYRFFSASEHDAAPEQS